MVEQFLHHINENGLFNVKDRILLGVSGGVDSVVMADLFRRSGFNAGVAHCNFQLRGAESDEDARFVERFAARCGMPFHSTVFETGRVAQDRGISIQMAARELRARWFDELLRAHKYAYVATAHHLNDVLETVLLNLTRGTGIDGLAGIPVRQQRTIRPLLFASRDQINSYAREQDISWREDSSNATDDYQRNMIRHHVVPVLRQINPNLEETFSDTSFRLRASREFVHRFLKDFSIRNINYDGKHVQISKEELMDHRFASVILWELIKDLGFNFDQCIGIAGGGHQPGVVFTSSSHRLTVDRDAFVISRLTDITGIHVEIPAGATRATGGGQSLTLVMQKRDQFALEKDDTIAQLDYDKLSFPLIWRAWMEGDRFIPLGMTEHKKVSDFLIDEKVALPEKDHVTVIESGGEIVWIVGRRVSAHVRVTGETRNILIIRVDSHAREILL
jgi:tRNA(Ile)-lysidine synthase